MAIEGLNASRGIGNGIAQVYDTRGSVGYYLKTAAQQEAKRAAEQKALQDEMSKVKLDGIRQADVPEYTTEYNKWKDLSAQINKEGDLAKKAMLRRNFDEQELKLQNIVQDSKGLAKGETALNSIFMDPAKRDNFTDDAVSKYQLSKTLPRTDPRYIRDLTAFERKVDTNKVLQGLDKDDEYVMKSSKFNNPVETPFTQGNRKGVMINQDRVIDPTQQIQRYSAKYDADPDTRVALKQLYPDIAKSITDPTQLKQALVTQLAKDRVKREYKAPIFKENDDWKEKALFNDSLVRARKSLDGEGVGSAQPISIPFAKGKASVNLDHYVPISISKKNFAGSPYIDLATGKEGGKLPSSSDYEVVGVGNAPFIKSGDLKGAISQPEYANRRPDNIQTKPIIHVQIPAKGEFGKIQDYFIPYDRLPENVKNSKQVKQALSKFTPASTQQSTPVKQSSRGMVTMILPNGQSGQVPSNKVSDFIKKYPKAKRQ